MKLLRTPTTGAHKDLSLQISRVRKGCILDNYNRINKLAPLTGVGYCCNKPRAQPPLH